MTKTKALKITGCNAIGVTPCILYLALDINDVIVAIVCAAGGSKAFSDHLKTWVEERSGRKIRIRKGDIELEIQGGISEKKLKETIELFEESFGKSKVLSP